MKPALPRWRIALKNLGVALWVTPILGAIAIGVVALARKFWIEVGFHLPWWALALPSCVLVGAIMHGVFGDYRPDPNDPGPPCGW